MQDTFFRIYHNLSDSAPPFGGPKLHTTTGNPVHNILENMTAAAVFQGVLNPLAAMLQERHACTRLMAIVAEGDAGA